MIHIHNLYIYILKIYNLVYLLGLFYMKHLSRIHFIDILQSPPNILVIDFVISEVLFMVTSTGKQILVISIDIIII